MQVVRHRHSDAKPERALGEEQPQQRVRGALDRRVGGGEEVGWRVVVKAGLGGAVPDVQLRSIEYTTRGDADEGHLRLAANCREHEGCNQVVPHVLA